MYKKSLPSHACMYYEAHSLIHNFLTDKTSECSQLCVVEKLMIVTTIINTLIQPEPLLRIIPLHISKKFVIFLEEMSRGFKCKCSLFISSSMRGSAHLSIKGASVIALHSLWYFCCSSTSPCI